VSGFDGENDLLGFAPARFVVEIKAPVNAAIRAFFLHWTGDKQHLL